MKPEDFKQIMDSSLSGLMPSAELKGRILAAGNNSEVRKEKPFFARYAPAISFAAVIVVCCALVLPMALGHKSAPEETVLASQAAGGAGDIALVAAADLTRGSVSVGSTQTSGYTSIWEKGNGANFPLVMIDGKAYRMLKSDFSAASLKGDSLGNVDDYTDEPSLSEGNIVSNTVELGTEVFAVSGMKGAFVCADVGGKTRAFQRVSYAGTDTVSGETLMSTLAVNNVARIEVSGVGTITDADTISSLVSTLCDNASSYGASKGESGSAVLFFLNNGLCVQLFQKDDIFSACGAWVCPEFRDALSELFAE